MTSPPDGDLYRFLVELAAQLRETRDPDKALRTSARAAMEQFGAEEAAVGVIRRGAPGAELAFVVPPAAGVDSKLLDAFIGMRRPEVPEDQILAPVRRRGMPWGALWLRRRASRFEPGEGRRLARVTAVVSGVIEEIDRERLLEVRTRIDRKLMEGLRPKDLFYQILHGLRSLMHYDHSSALLVAEDHGRSLHLVAEQIAWRKGKSRRIGTRLPLPEALRSALGEERALGFDREGDGWRERRGRDDAGGLAALFDYNRGDGEPGPREAAMLIAPLATGEGLIGLLKIAGRAPGTFGAWDAEVLERFVPQASIAIQNSRRTESLEARMLAAEKKHVMAELARGVSHDINNALGSVLPLVQQLQADLADGRLDPEVLGADLAQIHTSLQVCRRIFSGMLAFARGAERRQGPAEVAPAVANALAVLEDGMGRRGIRVNVDLAEDVPALPTGQGDLEQLLLNLLTNARDAMPDGGAVQLAARRVAGAVELTIEDTGPGIPAEHLSRVQEPFFSTKAQGNGLGLSICRSIVWEMNGDLEIASRPGEGTRVRIRIPEPAPRRGEARA